MESENVTLLVFCKQPRLHQGKQRLAATLGAEKALRLAEALLDCAMEDAAAWPGRVVLSPSHPDQQAWAETLLSRPCSIMPQPEGNLGQRINSIDARLRQQGHEQIIVIGTDAPILNAALYKEVVSALSQHDVVLSNADDGGVTLMAASAPWPDLADLSWSTNRLGNELAGLCQRNLHNVGYVMPSYDIDVEADLHKLTNDLAMDSRPARQALLSEVCNTLGIDKYA